MPCKLPSGAACRANEKVLRNVAMRAIPWDARARQDALNIPEESPSDYLAACEQAAKEGTLFPVAVELNGERVGTVFLQIERESGRQIAVIIGALAGLPGNTAWTEALPIIEHAAARLGCTHLRAETARPGVVYMMRGRDWRVSAVTLTKTISANVE